MSSTRKRGQFPEEVKRFDIVIHNQSNVFFSGDTLHGQVRVELGGCLTIQGIVVRVVGEAYVNVPENSREWDQVRQVTRIRNNFRKNRINPSNNESSLNESFTDIPEDDGKQPPDCCKQIENALSSPKVKYSPQKQLSRKRSRNSLNFRSHEKYFDHKVFVFGHKYSRHLHVVTVGNRRIWQSSWVNDKYAVMADTSDEYFTMQELGDPVSASGQGEKAGSQASSSNDCRSSLVGNLATGEYTITGRKLSDKTSSLQKRRQKSNKRTAELLSEELEERKKKRRLYMKNYRAKQSKEATQARLQHLRQSAAERRDTESEHAKKARLQQMRQHAAETRDSESELAKQARLQQMRQHAAENRDSESELAKEARLQQMRQHAAENRDSESELAKEARLQQVRQHGRREQLWAGQHTFPFDYTLPTKLPSSFHGRFGYIRYFCEASIERRDLPSVQCRSYFSVNAVSDVNKDPKSSSGSSCQKSTDSCFFCCQRGTIIVSTGIKKRAYVPGEDIIISADVINMSNRQVRKSSARLRQVVSYFSNKGIKGYSQESVVTEVSRGSVPSGESDSWRDIRLPVPPLPSTSKFENCCRLMDIDYRLDFVVEIIGDLQPMVFRMPILIGTIPLQKSFPNFLSVLEGMDFYASKQRLPSFFHAKFPDLPAVFHDMCVWGPKPVDTYYYHQMARWKGSSITSLSDIRAHQPLFVRSSNEMFAPQYICYRLRREIIDNAELIRNSALEIPQIIITKPSGNCKKHSRVKRQESEEERPSRRHSAPDSLLRKPSTSQIFSICENDSSANYVIPSLQDIPENK